MAQLETLIQNIIVERLMLPIRPEEIEPTVPLFTSDDAGGLGLDSLGALEILAGLSEHYQTNLDDIEPQDLRSVASLAAYLRRRGVESDNG